MFPSSIGENPIFPQFQQSVYSTSFGGLNGNCNNSIHHHNDLLEVSATTVPVSNTMNNLITSTEPAFTTNQEMNSLNGVHSTHLGSLQKQRCVKKDRHSKIVTAQGPRDRRVRLSIDIAQKFFGLQDMLGFDKASKTIDWLLTKSKAAIEEVVQMKLHSDSGDLEEKYSLENNLTEGGDGKQPEKAAGDPRANARARARERTRKKRCIKDDKIPGNLTNQKDESIYHAIQEPLSIKRKTKPSIFIQPNLISSIDASSEHYCCPYTTEHWDTTSSYAMTGISYSKVVQICGTPLEDTNNTRG